MQQLALTCNFFFHNEQYINKISKNNDKSKTLKDFLIPLHYTDLIWHRVTYLSFLKINMPYTVTFYFILF